MIKIENTEVFGFEAAIRGCRNPYNSWDKSDSKWYSIGIPTINPAAINDKYLSQKYCIGDNDLKLMKSLSKAGNDHAKFLRMINVTVDITAPLYWWKEHDQHKVGTTTNSCSTMHKIAAKEFTLDDFSCEHLTSNMKTLLKRTIDTLNDCREWYLKYDSMRDEDKNYFEEGITCKKDIWWQMIQLLPSSYNQKRTVQLNYQVLKSMYFARKDHKLDEWNTFCEWTLTLPYFKEICVDI